MADKMDFAGVPPLQFEKKGSGKGKVGRPALKNGEASSAPFMMLMRPDERNNLDPALAIFQARMATDPRIQEFLMTHFDATRGDPTSLAAAARMAATKNQMVKLALRLFCEQYLDFDITAPAPANPALAADNLPPT